MLNLKQFKTLIRNTLDAIALGGDTAVNLVMGTCLQESGLVYLTQLGGPALGIAQIEPATYRDICNRINTRLITYKKCLILLNMVSFPLDPNSMIGNMTLSIIICRLKYYLDPRPLPGNTVEELSSYYKTVYNTTEGAATMDQILKNFQTAIDT